MEDYSHILFNGKAIGSLIYLSICCTACAFVIYFWLVKHMEAIMLSLTAFITPVIAVIIAIILMEEEFTTMMYIGSLLVLVGVAVAILGDFVTLYRRRRIKC
jgi:drug/metabolite transporter (DMT)-like permease